MGVGAATALCRLVLMMQEFKAFSNDRALASFESGLPSTSLHILRYIDDVRIILVHPIAWQQSRIDATLAWI